jgi:hypothetical protein
MTVEDSKTKIESVEVLPDTEWSERQHWEWSEHCAMETRRKDVANDRGLRNGNKR